MNVPKFRRNFWFALSVLFCSSVGLAKDDYCIELLNPAGLQSVRARLAEKSNQLLKRFSQFESKVIFENDFALSVHPRDRFRGFFLLDPGAIPDWMGMYIHSTGTPASGAVATQEWNLFSVRRMETGTGQPTIDLVAHIGDWRLLSPERVSIQALNVLTAISMVPYFHHLIIDVPVFQSQTKEGMVEEMKALLNLMKTGIDDLALLSALNLTDVQLIGENIPVKVVKVKFTPPRLSEKENWFDLDDHNYHVDVFFELDRS